MSFGPSEAGEDDNDVFTPKKSNLGRIAAERNAGRKSALSDSRPSYSKDYLEELKSATPSRPAKSSGTSDEDDEVQAVTEGTREIDITSKFGPLTTLAHAASSAIPSDTEIREKKERRARLAKEQEYLSLNESDEEDGGDRLVLREKEQYPETRLVPDDEDVAEGFDDFTEDGKIALGKNAEREAQRRRKKEMAEMIAQAEGSDDEASEDDSEAERNAAYEAAQTRAGTYGERSTGRPRRQDDNRAKTPPRIAPVPELGAVLAKLRSTLEQTEQTQHAKEIRLDELRREKEELNEREKWIQTQLKETGERYEKLRLEAGLGTGAASTTNGVGGTTPEGRMFLDRGLESLGARGATPVLGDSDGAEE